MEFDGHFVGPPFDRRNQNSFRQSFQQGIVQQIANGRRRGSEPVSEFAVDFVPLGFIGNPRDSLIRPQTQILVRDVLLWDADIQPEVDRGAHLRFDFFALQRGHGPLQHLHIHDRSQWR